MTSESINLFEPFDQDMFETFPWRADAVREEIHEAAGRDEKKAQAKQKRHFDCQYLSSLGVNVENKILLKTAEAIIERVVNLPIAGHGHILSNKVRMA